jgi:hypothetical protein
MSLLPKAATRIPIEPLWIASRPGETFSLAAVSSTYISELPFKGESMKKLFTLVVTMLLGATLAFAQDTGGDKNVAGKKGTTTAAASGKKATKAKKGHKGGKKSKKSSESTTPPPK